jgi:phosphopantothenoylcysteine decarboxylase
MNILLGVTGSVASILTTKIALRLKEIGDVKIVATEPATRFFSHGPSSIGNKNLLVALGPDAENPYTHTHFPLYLDKHEWQWESEEDGFKDKWEKDDPVLHIELRDWADVFVIAPLSANTLAKMSRGLCDNLITSIFRAWDWEKPVIVAPAMNTKMWKNQFTLRDLLVLKEMFNEKWHVVNPVSKKLACGDEGAGAMADIEDIARMVEGELL